MGIPSRPEWFCGHPVPPGQGECQGVHFLSHALARISLARHILVERVLKLLLIMWIRQKNDF
jgi:hypothetical protein